MDKCTIRETEKFLSSLKVISSLADFGGGRRTTKKLMARILSKYGVSFYENYDLVGGTKTIDLCKEIVNWRFNTILCINVLEHTEDPFFLAKNIIQALEFNGQALIIAPFSWKKHGIDYFRFTVEGLMVLFKNEKIEFVYGNNIFDGVGILSVLVIKKI